MADNQNKKNLGRVDWIQAGFRALHSEGVKGVRAEALARELKISKGSFYWHFKNIDDLKQQMLEHWLELGSTAPAAEIWANSKSPQKRLEALVEFAAASPPQEYGGEGVELAIREWARVDPRAAKMHATVDEFRINALVSCLVEMQFGKAEANSLARLLYATLIGLEHLQGSEDRERLLQLQLKLVTSTVDEQK